MIDKLYQDSHLVQFYDYDNPWSESFDVISNYVKVGDSVLDIGCGTGTLSSQLIHKCKEIYALDLSVEMLNVAKEKTDAVNWIHASATTFSLDRKFDFIFLSGHSFQTLLTKNDRLALLENIARHLKDNGTFVFDSRNPLVKEWTTWGEKESTRYFKHPIFGIIKSWNDWELKDEIITYQTFYQVLHTDKKWTAASQISFPKKEEIYSLINQAGLSVIQLYGDWALNTYTESSYEMIFVGVKKKLVL
jgi:ubiquinone/menaquinone biosynthesis C-methylase UbiE